MQQKKSLITSILFIVLSLGILVGWFFLQGLIWPPPKPPEPAPDEQAVAAAAGSLLAQAPDGLGVGNACRVVTDVAVADQWTELAATARRMELAKAPNAGAVATTLQGLMPPAPDALGLAHASQLIAQAAVADRAAELQLLADKLKAEKGPQQPVVEAKPPPKGEPHREILMGDEPEFNKDGQKPFLRVKLTSKGAGVVSVVLPYFQAADGMGRPVWEADGHTPAPLELLPEFTKDSQGRVLPVNADLPSNLLYDTGPGGEDTRPLVRLGQREWKVVKDQLEEVEGQPLRTVAFEAQVDGIIVTKTYTLRPKDYHVGLQVKFRLGDPKELDDPKTARLEAKIRYHLTSGHGLPIEGEWYTYIFRNAVVGYDRGYRSLQDLRTISRKSGGDEVRADADRHIQYGGIAVQFFSSLVVLDQEHTQKTDVLARARPTVVRSVLKGAAVGVGPDGKSFDLVTKDASKFTIHVEGGPLPPLTSSQDQPLAVVYRTNEYDQLVTTPERIYTGSAANQLDLNEVLGTDVNVHLVSNVVELTNETKEVTHDYLLYNGPAKVSQLGTLTGAAKVDPNLVTRYESTLHLNTVTDSPSPGWFGENISGPTHLSDLLIWVTNRMHAVLSFLHWLIPNYGLCIIVLTLLVRGLMFPLSRRQAMTSVRMQALAPELKKFQEKYKDDRQALGAAQWELYRKHGVNPIGSCWTVFLQMPIFLGLYYALQESINARLASFLWIQNLAAPDMLFYWTQSIPFVSQPESYGSFFYLGPYFNLLPVIAACFMFVQQKLMTPPPADEQQEMQQRMMKFMTVFFALMFYKLAAGLCVYFIISSLWGFTERQLLPKRKTNVAGTPPEPNAKPSLVQQALDRLGSLRGQREAAPNGLTTTPAPTRQESAVTSAPVPPAPSMSTSGSGGGTGSRRKNRNKRKQERERRRHAAAAGRSEEGSAPPPGAASLRASTDSDGAGPVDRVRLWWADTTRRVRTWWKELLKQAAKRGSHEQ